MTRTIIRLLTIALVATLLAGSAPSGAVSDGGPISRDVEAVADENWEFAGAFDVEVIQVTGDVDFDGTVTAIVRECRFCTAMAAAAYVIIPRTSGINVSVALTTIAVADDCGNCSASSSAEVIDLALDPGETAFLNPIGWILVEIAEAKARLAQTMVTSVFFAGFADLLWNSARNDILRVLDVGITVVPAPGA